MSGDGADQEWMVHSLCDHGRRGGHWVSRDWDDIDCKAVGCKWNRNEQCMTPAQCKIGDDGRCQGFVAKELEINKKPDGD